MSSCSAIGFDSAASSARDLLSEQFMARILKNRHGWKIPAKAPGVNQGQLTEYASA
jgi:hypothetical protein